MRFGVVVFPGTWSDCDFHYVISEVLRQPVSYIWHREANLTGYDCVVLPGGFSYGDYLRAGAVAGRSPVVEALPEFVARGGTFAVGSDSNARIDAIEELRWAEYGQRLAAHKRSVLSGTRRDASSPPGSCTVHGSTARSTRKLPSNDP